MGCFLSWVLQIKCSSVFLSFPIWLGGLVVSPGIQGWGLEDGQLAAVPSR